jgi:hypothetical protein
MGACGRSSREVARSNRTFEEGTAMSNLWAWFNANTAAVQALASVVGLLVTIVLARLTAKYVSLTRTIATAAATQLQALQEATARVDAAALRGLAFHLTRLNIAVGLLNETSPSDQELRFHFQLTYDDGDQLARLAQACIVDIQAELAPCAASIRWLVDLADRVRSVNPGIGYAFSTKETGMYAGVVKELRGRLSAMTKQVFPAIVALAKPLG